MVRSSFIIDKINVIVAEWQPDDAQWLVVFPNGDCKPFVDTINVQRAVKGFNDRQVKKTGETVITRLEWRNTPAGFKAPT